MCPPRPKIFSISCGFSKFMTKSYVCRYGTSAFGGSDAVLILENSGSVTESLISSCWFQDRRTIGQNNRLGPHLRRSEADTSRLENLSRMDNTRIKRSACIRYQGPRSSRHLRLSLQGWIQTDHRVLEFSPEIRSVLWPSGSAD